MGAGLSRGIDERLLPPRGRDGDHGSDARPRGVVPRWLARFLAFAERIIDRVREVDWSETLSHKPVGRKEPNAWGLHDLHGNVWEWTETAVGVLRVYRGGSWSYSAGRCESSIWSGSSPDYRSFNLGFRLCATQRPAAEESHAESAEAAEP